MRRGNHDAVSTLRIRTRHTAVQLRIVRQNRMGDGRSWGVAAPIVDKRRMVLEISPDAANELLATFDTAPGTYRLSTMPLTLQVIDPTT